MHIEVVRKERAYKLPNGMCITATVANGRFTIRHNDTVLAESEDLGNIYPIVDQLCWRLKLNECSFELFGKVAVLLGD